MVGKADGAGMQNQISALTRKLESMHANKFKPDPAVETIQNIIIGNYGVETVLRIPVRTRFQGHKNA